MYVYISSIVHITFIDICTWSNTRANVRILLHHSIRLYSVVLHWYTVNIQYCVCIARSLFIMQTHCLVVCTFFFTVVASCMHLQIYLHRKRETWWFRCCYCSTARKYWTMSQRENLVATAARQLLGGEMGRDIKHQVCCWWYLGSVVLFIDGCYNPVEVVNTWISYDFLKSSGTIEVWWKTAANKGGTSWLTTNSCTT